MISMLNKIIKIYLINFTIDQFYSSYLLTDKMKNYE